MTSPVTPPTLTSPPPAPDRADRNTFSARATALAAFQKDTLVPEMQTAINSAQTNAISAGESAVAALANNNASYANYLSSLANSQSAAAAMGAPAWVSGTTYAVGDSRWSPVDGRVYRRRTAGAGTTDPSADPTNWLCIGPNGLQLVTVSGTSATITANTDTAFTNSSACAATVPALAVGESFVIRFDNGRLDNTVDLGSRSVLGLNGQTASGVITLNAQPYIALRWWGDYYRSN